MKKSFSGKLLNYFIVGLIILLIGYVNYRLEISDPADKNDATKISLTIKKGEGIKEISNDLKKLGLIKSTLAFNIYTKYSGMDTKIIAGRFSLSPNMSIKQIVENLSNIQKAEYVITIQEGIRVKDIDKKLVDLDLIQSGDFTKAVKSFNGWQYYDFLDKTQLTKLDAPLEGYLFPDTYFLDPKNFKPDDLIYLSLDNFENKIKEIGLKDKLGKRNLPEVIIMASIIENEVFGYEDQQKVSGILWKRLDNNWPLGADATLLYLSNDRIISNRDLQSDSPYNTRKNLGLPPGPISNPGLESLKAAINPVATPYWFYLTAKGTGEVIYGKSNEEQNINRQKYL